MPWSIRFIRIRRIYDTAFSTNTFDFLKFRYDLLTFFGERVLAAMQTVLCLLSMLECQ
jgi:hypothetical protein